MQVRIVKNKSVKGYRVVVDERIYLAPNKFTIAVIIVRYFDIGLDEIVKLLNNFHSDEMRIPLKERLQWKEV